MVWWWNADRGCYTTRIFSPDVVKLMRKIPNTILGRSVKIYEEKV